MDNTLSLQFKIIYGLFAVSVILQFDLMTAIIGLIGLVAAYFVLIAKKSAVKDTPFEQHYIWLNRTFWIGTAVYFPIAVILAAALILTMTDIAGVVLSASADGDPARMMMNIQNYLDNSMSKIWTILAATMGPPTIWWLWRCWKGFDALHKSATLKNPNSWLI